MRTLHFGAACVLPFAASMMRAESASAGSEPIVLDYSAPSSCPDEEGFRASVEKRTTRPVLVGASSLVHARVALEVHGRDAHAKVTVTEDGRLLADREISGRSCAEVAQASALLVALFADHDASAPPPTPPQAIVPREPAPVDRPAEELAGATTKDRTQLFVLAEGGATTGFGPGAGPALAVGIAAKVAGLPELRLRLRAGLAGEAHTADGSAAFRYAGGVLDSCPFVWGGRSIAISPCAGISASAFSARATGVAGATSDTRARLAFEATLRAKLRLGSTGLFVLAETGAIIPFARERYVFASDVPFPTEQLVHESSPVALLGTIGVGARFR